MAPVVAPTKPQQHPGLERLKKMAGTWVQADKDGKYPVPMPGFKKDREF